MRCWSRLGSHGEFAMMSMSNALSQIESQAHALRLLPFGKWLKEGGELFWRNGWALIADGDARPRFLIMLLLFHYDLDCCIPLCMGGRVGHEIFHCLLDPARVCGDEEAFWACR